MIHPENDNTGGKEKKIFKAEIVLILILTALILLPQLVGPVKKKEDREVEKWKTVDELNGKTFVSIPGSDYVRLIEKRFPKSRILYVEDWADQEFSIIQGKADAVVCEKSSAMETMKTYPDLCINLSKIKEDGTIDKIYKIWADPDKAPNHVEVPAMTGKPKGKIKIVTSLDWIPMCYRKGDEACGFFIDLCCRFCAWAGYEPVFEYVNIESALAGFDSGKYDLFAYGTGYKEEATDRMNFTDTIYEEPIYVMVRKDHYAYAPS